MWSTWNSQTLQNKGTQGFKQIWATKHKDSKGVQQDYQEALKWYLKAVEQGYDVEQSNKGTMYYRGEGVPQNHIKAVKWLKKAIKKNYISVKKQLRKMGEN